MASYAAVVGPSHDVPPGLLAAAEQIGRALAEMHVVVVTGGLGGVMEAASRGAASAGGVTVGLLPGDDRADGNPWLTAVIPTGLGELRNGLVVRAADVVVCVGGSWGTLSEVALAARAGTPVVAIQAWRVDGPGSDQGFVHVGSAEQAIASILEILGSSGRRPAQPDASPSPVDVAPTHIAHRPADAADEAELVGIERETWLPHVSPGVYAGGPFFDTARPDDVMVATIDGRISGYVLVRPPTSLASNAHVLAVEGLAVSPTARGRGVGVRLMAAVDERATERGVERITLRVLAVNAPARTLYESCGYRTEGVLHGEFRLPVGPGGAVVPVDDVLMAKTLGA